MNRNKYTDEDLKNCTIIKSDIELCCAVCGELTPYVDYCFETRMCGDDCLDELIKRININ